MSKKHPEPKIVKPEDIDPRHDWNSPLMALGQMAVDFEERVNVRRRPDSEFVRLAAGGKWIRTISTRRISDASFIAFGCVAYLINP